jgi:hypothetical protein
VWRASIASTADHPIQKIPLKSTLKKLAIAKLMQSWSPNSAAGAGAHKTDLFQTLDEHSWKVSVLAQTGLTFDLSTSSGKLMRTIMPGLAEFERDLIRDRYRGTHLADTT